MKKHGCWARAIRLLDPEALLILGPVPTSGKDETFHNPANGKPTFVIKAEKVPNAAGVRRIMQKVGGPTATFDDVVAGNKAEIRKLKGGWIVGGYLSNWIPTDIPKFFTTGFRVVQDILPNALTERADVLLPSATWAEKDGSWENFAGKIQPFMAAVFPPSGARREGNVYNALLGREGLYNANEIRKEMGEPFAAVHLPAEDESGSGSAVC